MSEAEAVTTELTKEQLEAQEAARKEAVRAGIKAKFDDTITPRDVKFNFKTTKVTDDAGNVVGENKRASLELVLPVISVPGLVKFMEAGGAGANLIMEVLQDYQIQAGRDIISEDESVNQDNFPYDKINWDYLANLPKAERRGGGIPKETWEEFGADYLEVMPGATGKEVKNIENQVKIYMVKFQTCKGRKQILALLRGQLAIYLQHSPNAEKFLSCVEWLDKKAEELLNITEDTMMAAL